MIIHKDSFTCYLIASGREKHFPSLKEAQAFAKKFCGNDVSNKPFSEEETYLYGPGDGTTSIMIRQDVEFK